MCDNNKKERDNAFAVETKKTAMTGRQNMRDSPRGSSVKKENIELEENRIIEENRREENIGWGEYCSIMAEMCTMDNKKYIYEVQLYGEIHLFE